MCAIFSRNASCLFNDLFDASAFSRSCHFIGAPFGTMPLRKAPYGREKPAWSVEGLEQRTQAGVKSLRASFSNAHAGVP